MTVISQSGGTGISGLAAAGRSANANETDAEAKARALARVLAPTKRQVRTRSLLTLLIMIAVDLVALAIALTSVVLVRYYAGGQFTLDIYAQLWPVLGLFIIGYAWAGLYPGIPYNPITELRRVFFVTAAVYLLLGSVTFITRDAETYSRLIFLTASVLSVFTIIGGRAITRAVCAHRPWWGHSVVILGGGRTGRRIVKLLRRKPGIGLKPIAILDDTPTPRPSFAGTPTIHGIDRAVDLAKQHPHLFFMVVIAVFPRKKLIDLLDDHQHLFRHLIVLPDFHGISSLGVVAHDFQGTLGIAVQQRLLDWRRRAFKRLLDILAVLAISPFVLPIMILIAIVVGIQTRGKIFFGQQRIGLDGKPFTAWKFRTMLPNADVLLEQYLETHPDMRRQWQWTGKFKQDPRVLPVGHFLRRFSLDELPQIWNVLVGDMAVVGPRPIIDSERSRYGRYMNLYQHVRPGLTGLWQVSGRNDTTYHDRVRLDVYYVRNWSVWLDIYILAKTPFIVLGGHGAY